MKAAIGSGASLVNDVNALQNPGALENVCDTQVDVCLMHMQGKPRTMQQNPKYKNVIDDIKDFLIKEFWPAKNMVLMNQESFWIPVLVLEKPLSII